MKKLILIAFVVLSACKPITNTIYETKYVRYDSIVEKSVHDTTIKYLSQKQSVVTIKKSYLKTDLAFSNAWIDSLGMLNHSIENFGFIPSEIITEKIKVTDKQKFEKRKIIYRTKTVYKTKNAILGKLDIGLLVLAGLYGLYRLIKFLK